MGAPIARCIIAAGFALVVHGRSARTLEGLSSDGATVVADPTAVAAAADVVLLALPDADAVSVVVDGMLGGRGLRAGTIVVDLSTIAPSDAIRTGDRIEAAGGSFVDAPMSGGPAAAKDGTLSLMVGGDVDAVAAASPVLEAFATSITHFGPVGSGQVAKACNQLVVMGTLEVIAEALTLASDAGIDPDRLRTAMLGGLAQSRILDVAGRRMLDDDFEPGGRIAFHLKDVATIRAMSAERRRSFPGFEAAAVAVAAVVDGGDGDQDHAAIVRHVRGSASSDPPTITFADVATSRRYELPGRDWTLLLGPQNSPSRRMTVSIASFPPGSGPPMHVHRLEDEVVYVISGRGRLEAEAGGGRLEPGASFHVPAGLYHGAVNDGDEPLVLLCTFSPPVVPGTYDPPPTG